MFKVIITFSVLYIIHIHIYKIYIYNIYIYNINISIIYAEQSGRFKVLNTEENNFPKRWYLRFLKSTNNGVLDEFDISSKGYERSNSYESKPLWKI